MLLEIRFEVVKVVLSHAAASTGLIGVYQRVAMGGIEITHDVVVLTTGLQRSVLTVLMSTEALLSKQPQ